MIVNHKYKFIFIKTRKTAGTSIEIALSKFCGPGDIITPISKEDEPKRRQMGGMGPQNFKRPPRALSLKKRLKALIAGKHVARYPQEEILFYNHSSASHVSANLQPKIWRNYYKFCFERNPFDRAISHYYWSDRDQERPINDYIIDAPGEMLSNWGLYTIGDEIAVDFVGRYEDLAADLATVASKLGLPELPSLPRAKSRFRLDRAHYSELLNPQSRAHIEAVCAKEMDAFHYRWQEAGVSV